MRHCSFCGSEVFVVEGCTERKFVFDDETDGTIRRDPNAADLVDPVPYGEEAQTDDPGDRCPTCHADPGRYHHPGCTVEECPNCGDTLVTCDCNPHALTMQEPEQ